MRREYAIAGSYEQFANWQSEEPERRQAVVYLSNAAACRGKKGKLHRIGTWYEQDRDLINMAEAIVDREQWEAENK